MTVTNSAAFGVLNQAWMSFQKYTLGQPQAAELNKRTYGLGRAAVSLGEHCVLPLL